MRKIFFCALLLTLALSCCAGAATLEGVWGLKFGSAVSETHAILSERGAKLLCEYGYQPNYREAFYSVSFFGREGTLLLRFSKKGLFLARFAFFRKGDLERAQKVTASLTKNSEKKYVAFTSHYNELKAMLTRKYGPASEELEENGVVSGERWGENVFGRAAITLYESRSLSVNDTVLSYEDTSRR